MKSYWETGKGTTKMISEHAQKFRWKSVLRQYTPNKAVPAHMATSTPTHAHETLAGLRDLFIIKMSNNQKETIYMTYVK